MKVNYMLDAGAYKPEKAHAEDAGFDIRTRQEFLLRPGKEVTIDTGVHVEIPRGYVGMLKSKSGLNVNNGITSEGVIDSGFTGSMVAKLRMDASQKYAKTFLAGDKITQLVILPIPEVEMCEVDSFAETDRGNNGFGSTGR